MPNVIVVDPATLHLPPTRTEGADPAKLARQMSQYGTRIDGIPPLEVFRDPEGRIMISDGVTRATRVAKLMPGTKIPADILGLLKKRIGYLPTVRDKLP